MLCSPPRALLPLLLALIALLGLSACEQLQQVAEFVDSISTGAPCESGFDCLGGTCFGEDQGFGGGYCSELGCEQEGCLGFSSECLILPVAGLTGESACFERCALDNSCDRMGEGYVCTLVDDTAICLPEGLNVGQEPGKPGAPCTSDVACQEGLTCLTNLYGGYCTRLNCDSDDGCQDGARCVTLNPQAPAEDQVLACMAACQQDQDCRFGYECRPGSAEEPAYCQETEAQEGPRNPQGADDGERCASNLSCKGAACIRELEKDDGQRSFPNGYCTTRYCADDGDCNGGICVVQNTTPGCMAACTTDDDCRQGYTCRSGREGRAFCDSIAAPPAIDVTGAQALEISCGSRTTYPVEVATGAQSFLLTPFNPGGTALEPRSLQRPDGSTLNIPRDYAFHAINPAILTSMAPMLFPASDDTSLARTFGAGTYTLNVASDAAETCHYVIAQPAPGTTLHLRFYLIGVPGLSAATAAAHSDLQAAISTMRAIYSTMNIAVEVAHYTELSLELSDSYSIIRDLDDAFELVSLSQAPGASLDENLVVNVFLIDDFAVEDAPGLLGISAGLPGAAGLHGSPSSGLVFSTAGLGQDNATVGQIMAHEIGHYLGLRHTTEHLGSAQDPITDTPSCLFPDLGYFCSDAKNFMFPFSLGPDQRQTTAGQSFVLRRNPLVRP
ncbi:zinc-dependent metalloprotease family protein [Lujinxingia litoralis]|nr:zinc-dependent metalloprotease family protein [Lujinxingia litoralis]